MDQLEFSLRYIKQHSLRAILLAPRLKRPPPGEFPITTGTEMITDHLRGGGNVGILGGNISILDFDNMSLMNEMFLALGIPEPTVRTGSGKIHCYVQDLDLPARIKWQGQLVGEIQRGEKQYVVAPPSIHPNGKSYDWLIENPEEPVPRLPGPWRQYLLAEMAPEVPSQFRKYIGQGTPDEKEEWDGPDASEIVRRALLQPGAVRRTHGVKFQCPGCAKEGHDKHRDNAMVGNDGRWGCAYAPGNVDHKREIGIALGVFSAEPSLTQIVQEVAKEEDVDDIMSVHQWEQDYLRETE